VEYWVGSIHVTKDEELNGCRYDDVVGLLFLWGREDFDDRVYTTFNGFM
jgi:hypothetical protein